MVYKKISDEETLDASPVKVSKEAGAKQVKTSLGQTARRTSGPEEKDLKSGHLADKLPSSQGVSLFEITYFI
jgi:hypothetical protein